MSFLVEMRAFLNFSERVLKTDYIIIFDSIIAMSLVCSFLANPVLCTITN